jgi:hypothetical protein
MHHRQAKALGCPLQRWTQGLPEGAYVKQLIAGKVLWQGC